MTGLSKSHSTPVAILLRALLVVLVVAALIGLGIVFVGANDTITQALLSVLVLGAACLFAVAAALAPRPRLLWSLIAVIAIEAIVVWVIIWMPSPPDALGRAAGMLALLLVVATAAVVLSRVVAGPDLRLPRIVARVAHVAGVVFLAMGWAMILTDGEALPGRVLAGVAIIYATSALAAVVIALMRSYTVVRRA